LDFLSLNIPLAAAIAGQWAQLRLLWRQQVFLEQLWRQQLFWQLAGD
jgi:hypothetical protein